MKKHIASILMVFVPAIVTHGEDSQKQYKIEGHIYRLFHEPIKVDWHEANSDVDKESNNVSYKIGETLLKINGEMYEWDGTTTPSRSDVLLLSRPNMVTLENQEVGMIINSGKTLEYLEKESAQNGSELASYRLHKIPISNELSLRARVLPGVNDENIRFQYTISVPSPLKREPLAGTSLDVGKPVYTLHDTTDDINTPAGYWFYSIVSLSKANHVLALFKVDEWKKE